MNSNRMLFDKISIDFYADIQIVTANKNVLQDNYQYVTFIKAWYAKNLSPEYSAKIEYIPAIDKFIFTVEADDDNTPLYDIADRVLNPQSYGKVAQRYLILNGRLCECHGFMANTMDLD